MKPNTIGSNIIKIGRGTVSDAIPTDFTNWLDIQKAINGEDGMPQLFPEKETMTYSTQADDSETSVLGKRAAIDEPIVFLWNELGKYTWAKMLQWLKNEDGSQGNCFWLGFYSASDMMTHFVKITDMDDKIPSQKGTVGEFATKEIKFGSRPAMQVEGNAFGGNLTKLIMSALTDVSATKKITWSLVANAVGYEVYNGNTLVARLGSTDTEYAYGTNAGTYYVMALGDLITYSNSEAKSIEITTI